MVMNLGDVPASLILIKQETHIHRPSILDAWYDWNMNFPSRWEKSTVFLRLRHVMICSPSSNHTIQAQGKSNFQLKSRQSSMKTPMDLALDFWPRWNESNIDARQIMTPIITKLFCGMFQNHLFRDWERRSRPTFTTTLLFLFFSISKTFNCLDGSRIS